MIVASGTSYLRVLAGVLALAIALAASRADAQITVQGLTDETVYAGQVTFTVMTQAGWTYTAELNGAPVPVGQPVLVVDPDYYELDVARQPSGGGAVESMTVQFIVRAVERGNSEWGLPPWVPLPPIPSAAAELAGATLRLIAPARFPRGLEVPVVANVLDAAGRRVGAVGEVRAAGFPDSPVRILRGVGSVLLPAADAAGVLSYAGEIAGLAATASVAVEGSTTWTPASGTIATSVHWGEDARVDVTADLTVAAGATLTIGAGSVVRLGPGVEVEVAGGLVADGTVERPIVFTPRSRAQPWGGLRLRGVAAHGTFRGSFFTGSGSNPDWFDDNPGSGSSHRDEEPCIYVSGGAIAELTDCWIIDNFGQAGHGEGSTVNLTRCLVQRCITTGQYNGGRVSVTDSALIEFPAVDAAFEDNDNDGLYLTGGAHSLEGSLIGWALDDGVDAGSGSAGSVTVNGCWFESCYHEGMAWSEDRDATVRDTVSTNNGQGIECGFGSPMVDVERILSTANLTGARFGDNYDWDYDGFLTVSDSLLLHNYRDIFGRAWDDWTVHSDQMAVTGNLVSRLDPDYPENALWDPALHAARLAPFLPTPATEVGVGWAVRSRQLDAAHFSRGVPARLSTFTTRTVTVGWALLDAGGADLAAGTLEFSPGETVERAVISDPDLLERGGLSLVLRDPAGAEITGFDRLSVAVSAVWIPLGAEWKYRASSTSQGTAWRALGFDDSAWPSGPAEFGFGDNDESTPIDGGPTGARYPTVYFRRRFDAPDPSAVIALDLRLLRDDGAVVYLNGTEVFRSNMPAGRVSYSTLASDAQNDEEEEELHPAEIDPAQLVAGENLVAVEVHQASATSSDLSFDFELTALLVRTAPVEPAFRRSDANEDGAADVSDVVKVLLVLFAGEATDCEAALDVDDSGAVNVTDAVALADYLFRGGARPSAPFPACGRDPTADGLECSAVAGCP